MQLLDIMKTQRMPNVTVGHKWDAVRKTMCSAYFVNAARIKGIGEYVNMLTGMPCHLHPSSALFGLGYTPDYVVYHELVLTSKEYMRTVTAVDAEWLAELGPMFFSIKESFETRMAKKRQQATEKRKMEAEFAAKAQNSTAERAEADRRDSARRMARQRMDMATPGRGGAGGASAVVKRTPRRFGL